MAYAIRQFTDSDAPALYELTIAAIRTVGAGAYSPEQVEAWAARHSGPARFIERVAHGDLITVICAGNDKPVAYALLERPTGKSGHIDMLYCHPEHTRQGLADMLLLACEDQARDLELLRLYTEASELAKPAFARAGYTVQHRRDFDIEGVAIHNYAMDKPVV